MQESIECKYHYIQILAVLYIFYGEQEFVKSQVLSVIQNSPLIHQKYKENAEQYWGYLLKLNLIDSGSGRKSRISDHGLNVITNVQKLAAAINTAEDLM